MLAGLRRKSNKHTQFRPKKSPSKISNIKRLSPQLAYHAERANAKSVVSIPSAMGVLRTSISGTESPASYLTTIENKSSLSYNHYSSYSTCSTEKSSHNEQMVFGILDGITSLCLGDSQKYPKSSLSRKLPHRRKQTVVHPVTIYPTITGLDSKKLVFERRKLFFQQNLFRPISHDE